MKTTKQFDNKKFEELVEQVAISTDDNRHSEALTMIADFFGYPEYQNLFKCYSEKESLTLADWNTRYGAQTRMLIVIESEYGNDTVTRLLAVL